MAQTIAFHNGTVIPCTGADPIAPATVVVEGDRIRAVGPSSQVSIPRSARVVDLEGRTLLPGLIDAHVHLCTVTPALDYPHGTHPGAVYAFAVGQNMTDCLMQGFTTVRDTGGLGRPFQMAVERGYVKGPRTLLSNSYLSQTGGHGDIRGACDYHEPHHDHPLALRPAVCDGPDQVRRMAREQLRTGASQLKIMAGGGAMSPTDKLETTQYTPEEIAAATYEAQVVGKYVTAHVYVPDGIKNCAHAGVRCIEHGNLMDEECARLMAEKGMFLVPTLIIFEALLSEGPKLGVPEENLEKIRIAWRGGEDSVRMAMEAGVRIGSGSDLLGPLQRHRMRELELKAEVMGPMASLVSATRTNAELIGMQDDLGTVEEGKLADLIVAKGNPLEDITVLQDPDNVPVVMQGGVTVKELAG